MSEKVLCEKSDLVAIADAVREATGSAENYNVSELSAATVGAISAGGSGGSVETCTVILKNGNGAIIAYGATVLDDGGISATGALPKKKLIVTLENVLCNSAVYLKTPYSSLNKLTLTNAELLLEKTETGDCIDYVFKVTANAGETAEITLSD